MDALGHLVMILLVLLGIWGWILLLFPSEY
jgi:hypothetical protein